MAKTCKKNCKSKKCEKSCDNKTKTQTINVPVVVEAVKTEPVTETAPQQETRNEDATVTAERIQKNATNFYSLYERYNTLRELARVLNGLPQNNPIPDAAKIDKISMSFTVNGKSRTVDMADVRLIGEIAPLIANTLSTFIEHMHQEIFTLNTAGTAMQQAIENTILRREAPQPPADQKPQ